MIHVDSFRIRLTFCHVVCVVCIHHEIITPLYNVMQYFEDIVDFGNNRSSLGTGTATTVFDINHENRRYKNIVRQPT